MAHQVLFYDVDKGFDEDGVLRPSRVVECENGKSAVQAAIDAIVETQSIMAASVRVDWRMCGSLAEYLEITNGLARHLERNPIEGAWIGGLTEDLDYWAEIGVTTPEQMEKHLALEHLVNIHKETYGVKPRGGGLTMDSPIEEIEKAIEAYYPKPSRSEDEAASLEM